MTRRQSYHHGDLRRALVKAAVSLVDCVRRVVRGERALDQSMIVRALDRMLERQSGMRHAAEVLSRRETEIVKMDGG